ncbi:hypothetical protein [Litoribrevibacter albus]|uniref:Uncharacterized protein n=1 Tax=Litoribrevibacter albus TaxID=1473156 RepID=A0AA37SF99_9GAMM|nr:hypothetical protein [Litoribrevibacter albus]GLQ33618.1 hypothetical protein GCM10007876_40980 [Litoribrevibacter albus]
MTMDELERHLRQELERIDAVLNQKALTWYGIRKAVNILKTRNHSHYPSLLRHVFMDIREMYIEQLSLDRLYPRLDLVMELAIRLDRRLSPVPLLDEPVFKLPTERTLEIAC